MSGQLVDLLVIFGSLRVSHCQHLHEVVSWIGEARNRHVDQFEMFDRSFGISLVHDVTVCHENEFVEEEERLRAGLVDC